MNIEKDNFNYISTGISKTKDEKADSLENQVMRLTRCSLPTARKVISLVKSDVPEYEYIKQ